MRSGRTRRAARDGRTAECAITRAADALHRASSGARFVASSNDACVRALRSMRSTRSMQKIVREIEHSSSNREEISCDPMRLRVQSDLKFGCSCRWSNKQRSITELNSDSHSKKFFVSHQGRHANETPRSWVVAPASNQASLQQQRIPSSSNAGICPAFVLRAVAASCARGAGFISVSGFGPDRSALYSDMRLSKRTSGSAAATVPLHAPMNSPKVLRFAAASGFRFQPSSTH